jgi:formylglycine-generating enzyme required for sulfatase activity
MIYNGLELVAVPDGPFLMGTDPCTDPDSDFEEQPQRRVWVSSFEIQRTPVTVAFWNRFLRETGYNWEIDGVIANLHPEVQALVTEAEAGITSPEARVLPVSTGDQFPITWVSWFDCMRFVEWYRERTGEEWSLPTECQWEKACRGTDGRLYPWGSENPFGWEEAVPFHESSLPVGGRPDLQSPYGCLDMWWNVSEWCLDWYDPEWYTVHPEGCRDPQGPPQGQYRVFRGGCPLDSGWPRCSWRGFQHPAFRHGRIGFRMVLRTRSKITLPSG